MKISAFFLYFVLVCASESAEVMQYEILSDSWNIKIPMTEIHELWSVAMAYACVEETCQNKAFFSPDSPYLPCVTLNQTLLNLNASWYNDRIDTGSCNLVPSEWDSCNSDDTDIFQIVAPFTLRLKRIPANSDRFLLNNVIRTRMVFIKQVNQDICQVRTTELSFNLPVYEAPIMSVILKNKCVDLGYTGPASSILTEISTDSGDFCYWRCHSSYIRRPWNAEPLLIGSPHTIYCQDFPSDFIAIFVGIEMRVSEFWNVKRLPQMFFDTVDTFSDLLEAHIEVQFKTPLVTCTVRGSRYDFHPDLVENVHEYIAREIREDFKYELITNKESVIDRTYPSSERIMHMDCRILTSNLEMQLNEIESSFREKYNSLFDEMDILDLLGVHEMRKMEIQRIIRYCKQHVIIPAKIDVDFTLNSMHFVEFCCFLILALIVGSRFS